MRRGRKTEIMLVVLGIVLIAVPFYIHMKEERRIQQYVEEFGKEEDEGKQNVSKGEDNPLLIEEDVIGIIEIPSLDLKYPIFEGIGAAQLNEGIGHMETTTPLCKKGNCVLAGHNGSRRGVYFTTLCNVELGAVVRIINKEKEVHEYTIGEVRVVNPYDSWVTEESEEEILTLFTCASHGTKRFAVKCVPAKDYNVEDPHVAY